MTRGGGYTMQPEGLPIVAVCVKHTVQPSSSLWDVYVFVFFFPDRFLNMNVLGVKKKHMQPPPPQSCATPTPNVSDCTASFTASTWMKGVCIFF